MGVYAAREVLDTEGAEKLGIGPEALVLTVDVEAGDLGRLALAGHRHRIINQVQSGDFGANLDLPAAPVESEEAIDLLAAVNGASNFADSRAALTLYALRQAASNDLGELDIRASWTTGGFEGAGRPSGSTPAFGRTRRRRSVYVRRCCGRRYGEDSPKPATV